MEKPTCWIDGRYCAAEEAHVSVLDHGLLYGDGAFEGIRVYYGRAFYLAAHLRRLVDSCRLLDLKLPRGIDEISQACGRLAEVMGDGYLRLVVTRGEGGLGLDPRHCTRPTVFVIAAPIRLASEEVYAAGARLITAGVRRLSSDSLDGRAKTLNYLNSILAKQQANAAAVDEALLLNRQGYVAEGTAENLFVVRNGRLLTPPPADGGLDGITRRLVLRLAGDQGLEAGEAHLTLYDVYTADEAFLTGTAAELIPVREVDGRALPAPGSCFGQLAQAFKAHVQAVCREGAAELRLE